MYAYLPEFRNPFLCSLILFNNISLKNNLTSIAICKLEDHLNVLITSQLSEMALCAWKGEKQNEGKSIALRVGDPSMSPGFAAY